MRAAEAAVAAAWQQQDSFEKEEEEYMCNICLSAACLSSAANILISNWHHVKFAYLSTFLDLIKPHYYYTSVYPSQLSILLQSLTSD